MKMASVLVTAQALLLTVTWSCTWTLEATQVQGCPAPGRNKSNNHWKLPPWHWLHWIMLNPHDTLGWRFRIARLGKSRSDYLCEGALGLLAARQSHLPSEAAHITSKAVLQTMFSSVHYMLALVPGTHLHTRNQANCLADCYNAPHLFDINPLHHWLCCQLTTASFAECGQKCLENTLPVT